VRMCQAKARAALARGDALEDLAAAAAEAAPPPGDAAPGDHWRMHLADARASYAVAAAGAYTLSLFGST